MRYCICGRLKEERIGTVEIVIFDFKIVVHKTPHFWCSYCGTRSFDSKSNIDEVVKYAFASRISEIDYVIEREKL